jgi:hypothetical protein
MEIEVATFESKCGQCGKTYPTPQLADMAYGEFIFCSADGRVYAHCDAFSASAKLIEVLLPENYSPELFRRALAELADPILGRRLTPNVHCYHCGSIERESWGGKKIGMMWVKATTYDDLIRMERNDLIERIAEFVGN